MIPDVIEILHGHLPDHPGVYFYYNQAGDLLYIGKATSLQKRVGSYFTKAHNDRIADLVARIHKIDYIETPTVIEALVLETKYIREKQPPYNILSRDDKSFLYLCVTNEEYPKPVFLRGLDLERLGIRPFSKKLSPQAKKRFLAVFGPYISGRSLRLALDLVRKSLPWSTCTPGDHGRPCFDAQIGRCPGVCTRKISVKEYRKIIHQLIQFFDGKKAAVKKGMEQDMKRAVQKMDFETAANIRNKIFALEHIHDVALITRDDGWEIDQPTVQKSEYLNIFGRIEAYDIAHIGGTSTVAAMVVFENGRPKKEAYRKFRIKSFQGTNDVLAMEEVIRRRIQRLRLSPNTWPKPELLVIDGGEGQVQSVRTVLDQEGVAIPIVGIAKGFDRKQDRLVFQEDYTDLRRVVESSKDLLQRARDEAHRFANVYHRVLRAKRSGIPKKRKTV